MEVVGWGSEGIVLGEEYMGVFVVFVVDEFNGFGKGNIYVGEKEIYGVEYLW